VDCHTSEHVNEGPHSTSEQLGRYLAGESDAAEHQAVEAWAAADPSHAQELEALRKIWALSAGTPTPEVDVDRAWLAVQARIDAADGVKRIVPQFAPAKAWRWAVAAAVLIGAFVGVRYLTNPPTEQLMATHEFLRTVLPDSSSIVLSPGSRADVRMTRDRHVALTGEAYFEVQRDVERPFVVKTDDVTVTVLGTAFEVSAFDTSASVLVRVRHGRVRVEVDGDSVVLNAGGYARYNKAAHLLERMPAPPAVVFGDRIIQFQEAAMTEVVAQLQQLFPVRIELAKEALKRCRLTATFEDEPINYILRVIADTYGLTLTEVAPGYYVLDGEGC
jgi:transmembrane sensor